MHVLPLPFGLALALMPRREADNIRRKDVIRPHLRTAIRPHDRVNLDVRSFHRI